MPASLSASLARPTAVPGRRGHAACHLELEGPGDRQRPGVMVGAERARDAGHHLEHRTQLSRRVLDELLGGSRAKPHFVDAQSGHGSDYLRGYQGSWRAQPTPGAPPGRRAAASSSSRATRCAAGATARATHAHAPARSPRRTAPTRTCWGPDVPCQPDTGDRRVRPSTSTEHAVGVGHVRVRRRR